jgi:hypothetical protein
MLVAWLILEIVDVGLSHLFSGPVLGLGPSGRSSRRDLGCRVGGHGRVYSITDGCGS